MKVTGRHRLAIYIRSASGEPVAVARQRTEVDGAVRFLASTVSCEPLLYQDIGVPGTYQTMPTQLARALADAELGRFDMLVISNANRLSFSLVRIVQIADRLHSAGVAVFVASQRVTLQELLATHPILTIALDPASPFYLG